MDFNYGRRPAWKKKGELAKPMRVKKFIPLDSASYSRLEGVFRSFHPDLKKEDLDPLWRAFNFMKLKHKDQYRKSKKKEPYQTHPFNVAYYMAKAGGSLEEVSAALLHDTVEDTDTSLDEIDRNFGSTVAEIVSLLSTPKIRLNSKKPTMVSSLGVNIPLVYPDHEHYLDANYNAYLREKLKMTPEQIKDLEVRKKTLKDEHRELFVKTQKNRLFPDDSHITDLHWSAIWIKQFDALHNLQTIGGLKPDDRVRFVSKSLDMALFLSSRLTPVIGRSIPPNVVKIIESLRKKGAPVSHLLPRKTDPKNWYLMLPPRNRLTYARLMEIPPVTDQVVNIHRVVEVNKVKGKEIFHETVSDNHFEVLVPYHLIGSSSKSFETFFNELKFHLDPNSNLLERGRIGVRGIDDTPPSLKLPIVLPGESLLRPGVSGFHVFNVNLSQLELPNARAYRKRLLNAIKHTLVRFTTKSLLHLPVTFRNGIVNKTPSKLLWLPSSNDPNHVAVFLPHLQFDNKLQTLVPRIVEFSEPSVHIRSVYHEPTHLPAHTLPSFNTFVINFNKNITPAVRVRVLDQLGRQLRARPRGKT